GSRASGGIRVGGAPSRHNPQACGRAAQAPTANSHGCTSYGPQAPRATLMLRCGRNRGIVAQSIEVDPIQSTRHRGPAGRIPPHNLEAEESLLGAMMLSREAIKAAIEARLEPADCYKPAHGAIYESAFALHSRGEPVDPVTVAEELRRASQLDQLGGRATLLRIQASTPASANAAHYAQIVGELAVLRRLIETAGDIQEMAY